MNKLQASSYDSVYKIIPPSHELPDGRPTSIRDIINKKKYNYYTYGQIERDIVDDALFEFIHNKKYSFDRPNNNLTIRTKNANSADELLESMRFYGRPIQIADDAKLSTGGVPFVYPSRGPQEESRGSRCNENPEVNYERVKTQNRDPYDMLFSDKNRVLNNRGCLQKNADAKLWTDGRSFLGTEDPEELLRKYSEKTFGVAKKGKVPINYYEHYLYFRGHNKNTGDESRGGAEFGSKLYPYNMKDIY